MGTAQAERKDVSRRERRKREVHSRIVSAAIELFDRRGFDSTKVDDICEQADVAQKTFFNHFATKQQLVQEIAEDSIRQLVAAVEAEAAKPGSTAERLTRIFGEIAHQAERAGPMHRELVLELIRAAHADRSDREQGRRMHAVFGDMIRRGVADGDFEPEHSLETLTELVVGAFYVIMLNWVTIQGYPLKARATEAARALGAVLGGAGRDRPPRKPRQRRGRARGRR